MSPPTLRLPLLTTIAPFETMSPRTSRLPAPETEIASPPTPPHPFWLSAARVGVYRRLFTPPEAVAASLGVAPLVRIRANCRSSDRVAVMVNWLPCGPSADTTWVSSVPSEYVQVTVYGTAVGTP